MLTISWLLSSICCLSDKTDVLVKFWGITLPWLPATDPDGENILRFSIFGWEFCNPAIKDVGMPYRGFWSGRKGLPLGFPKLGLFHGAKADADVVELANVMLVMGEVTPVWFITVEAVELIVPTVWSGIAPMPEFILALLTDVCVGCPSIFGRSLFRLLGGGLAILVRVLNSVKCGTDFPLLKCIQDQNN